MAKNCVIISHFAFDLEKGDSEYIHQEQITVIRLSLLMSQVAVVVSVGESLDRNGMMTAGERRVI